MIRRLLSVALLAASPALAQEKFIVVASTTSTEQSGLFGYLLPVFQTKTGIQVRVVALGTGQALDLARRGDADVVFVHARSAEEKFLAEGHGVRRFDVMYNDFVLIGPKSDPAKISGGKDILEGLRKIKAANAPFVSRGDNSGTHIAELDLWKLAGIDVAKDKGSWYRDTGQGMGPALNTAGAGSNFPMAVDVDEHRLLVAFRSPAKLMVFATRTGKLEGSFDLCRDADDVFVDPQRRRLYVSCGEGVIDVLAQTSDGYERVARIPTVAGARTSLFAIATVRLYLGVRATAAEPAAIWVFRPQL